MAEDTKGLKLLVRLGDANLDGKKPLYTELTKVKGVSFMFSNAALRLLKIDKKTQTGTLSEETIEKIENFLKNPQGVPIWMVNRQKEHETGKNMHLISSDLDYAKGNDIKLMKKIKCWKGIRHTLGQPVRGQCTRSHFRTKGKKSSGIKSAPIKQTAAKKE